MQSTIKMKVDLDDQWLANHQPTDDAEEYLKQRIQWAIGFRGQVQTLQIKLKQK